MSLQNIDKIEHYWRNKKGSYANTIRKLLAEIARLQPIVDKLSKTADGVPMFPGMEVWTAFDFQKRIVQGRVDCNFPYMRAIGEPSESSWGRDIYSTREAAILAQGTQT